jgi:hypothetical protein
VQPKTLQLRRRGIEEAILGAKVDSSLNSSQEVLNDLDPLSRALLDLSIQRGMEDAEIAEVLGTDAASVHEVRVGLLQNLAEKVAPEQAGAELAVLEAAVVARLYPDEAAPVDAEEPTVDAEELAVDADDLGDEVDEAELDETPIEAEPPAEVQPPRPLQPSEPSPPRGRRSPVVILLPLLLLAAVVALIVALAGGGEDEGENTRGQPASQSAGKHVRLEPIAPSRANGDATLDGDRLTLTVRGLPKGRYEAWLYNSVIDAAPLKTLNGSKLTVSLPDDVDRYRYVDISREPADGNPNHSGQSVLRVPLADLKR